MTIRKLIQWCRSSKPSEIPSHGNGLDRRLTDPRAIKKGCLPRTLMPVEPVIGSDFVFVIDISGSMNTPDIPPSRIVAAKYAAIDMVDERRAADPNGRLGIVAFSEKADLVAPLTPLTKSEELKRAIAGISTRSANNLLDGFHLTKEVFDRQKEPVSSRHILILTDGHEANMAETEVAAERVKQLGCEIYCIGVGGNPSEVDETFLRRIASKDQGGRPQYEFISNRKKLKAVMSKFARCVRR